MISFGVSTVPKNNANFRLVETYPNILVLPSIPSILRDCRSLVASGTFTSLCNNYLGEILVFLYRGGFLFKPLRKAY